MKSNKGFSLVELIVVIAIMAIIAAVAIPVYSNYITRANVGAKQNEVSEFIHSAQIDYVDTKKSAATPVAVAVSSNQLQVTIGTGTAEVVYTTTTAFPTAIDMTGFSVSADGTVSAA